MYIPSCANAKDALCELYSAIREQQTFNPDGFFIIAGDFNHANLKSFSKVLPTCELCNKGKQLTVLCLYSCEKRI